MATSLHRGQDIVVYEATTQGNSPADDGNTYDAEGDLIHCVGSLDVSSIEQQLLEDERSVNRLFERAGVMVKSLRNTSLSIPVYLTGKNSVTADTQSAAETASARLLEHCLGGISINKSTTAKVGGTHAAGSIELTSIDSYAVGQFIGVIDADDNQGTVHMRRVKAIASDVVTFDRPLPFTPADGDKVPGCITIYCDQDVVEDSAGAANRTHSIFVRKAASSAAVLELLGCKAALEIAGLNRGELPTATLAYQVATFRTSADDGTGDVSAISSTPSFDGTLHGAAPISMGPRTKMYCQDYGSESATSQHLSNVEVSPGITVSPIETSTSAADNMEGLAGWSIDKPAPTASFQVVPHTQDFNTDLEAETFKNFMIERQDAEGKVLAISMLYCEVSSTPKLDANGNVLATNVTLRGHEAPDAVGTTDLAKTPLAIGMC